ncbi:hypothetical protein GCM10023261_16140 [Bartonella jaculi]|uniref:Uncharacterized protein n=1 Tax=Bartonella jaculi TaxID=686226 RepID=A0ABP9N8G0_9HYPH
MGGVVCGIFEEYFFENSKKNMAARFLREDVNTGSNIYIRLVCKICSRRFKRDHLIGAL